MKDMLKKILASMAVKLVGIGMTVGMLILAVIFVMRLIEPKEHRNDTAAIPARSDSLQMVKLIRENDELKAKVTKLESVLGTRKKGEPSSGSIGRPPVNFMVPETVWLPGPDSGRFTPVLANKQDFPIGIILDQDELVVNTFNPFLQAMKSYSFKQYRFPREEKDFTLASIDGVASDKLDGIVVYWTRPLIRWNGIFGEIGYGVFGGPHLSINASISIVDHVDLLPTIRTGREAVEAELNMRFKLW